MSGRRLESESVPISGALYLKLGGCCEHFWLLLSFARDALVHAQTVFVHLSIGGATDSPQRSFPGVGYLVQHVLHARGLR
jgi:hypothetical protein